MNIKELSGKTVVVTGAGSGIGRETAIAFAGRGARTAICDVDDERLEDTARVIRGMGVEVFTAHVDVGSRAEMATFAEQVHAQVDAIDILVNNAGVGLGGEFLDTSLDDWEWITRINLFGVVHGCHFFLPHMVAAGRGGHVVNVASMAAYAPLPAQSAYAATKAAVIGLSETLRAELATARIGVTAICPGFINTRIVQSSRLRGVAADTTNIKRTAAFYQKRNYTPERVAHKILDAVRRDRAVAPVSAEAWATYYASRLVPGVWRFANRTLARFGMS